MKKKVSIIIPTYNQARYLRPCIDSVWFQGYSNLEIIIVNDGATDDTADTLSSFRYDVEHATVSFLSFYDQETNELKRSVHMRYPKEGRKLKIIQKDSNEGLAAALNSGLSMASGEYVTYVPSDNVCYPHMINELSTAMEETGVDLVYSDMHIIDDQYNILRSFRLPDYSFKSCFQDWYLCGVSKLYKRSLHRTSGGYDEDLLAHDHALYQRFALNGARFSHVPKVLMGVRRHFGKDREIDLHSHESWTRLLEESRQLVIAARKTNAESHD